MAKRHLAALTVCAGLVLSVAGCGGGAVTTAAASADGTGAQEAFVSADYPAFTSVKEMWDDADLVVQANVTGMRTERNKPSKILEPGDEGYDDPKANPLYGLTPDELAEARRAAEQEVGDIVTIATAEITHVFKGDPADVRSVEVRQLGGELDGEKLTALDEVKLDQDKSYLLFLHAWEDAGDHTMLSPEQGQYVATGPDGRAARSAKAGDTYTPLPGNGLQVTRAALDELAKTD